MATGPRERLAAMISDVEKAARQLRADIRKRAQAAPKSMEEAAKRLRKGAADVTGQVERYLHDLRVNLEGRSKTVRRTAARKTKSGTARRARTRTKRRSA
jgi:hypothetical protein